MTTDKIIPTGINSQFFTWKVHDEAKRMPQKAAYSLEIPLSASSVMSRVLFLSTCPFPTYLPHELLLTQSFCNNTE